MLTNSCLAKKDKHRFSYFPGEQGTNGDIQWGRAWVQVNIMD